MILVQKLTKLNICGKKTVKLIIYTECFIFIFNYIAVTGLLLDFVRMIFGSYINV